jgi:hypothetical protein
MNGQLRDFGRFIHQEINPRFLLGMSLGGSLDAVKTRKILQSRESNTDLPARIPSIYQLRYPD